jgi:Holliday junction resolvase RusA-like endonuclease
MPVFTIEESIFPYVRMTQKTKFTDPTAQMYLRNKGILKFYLQQQMDAGEFSIFTKQPMGCDLSFNVVQLHKCDLDNLVKAVLDAAQGIVFTNDSWIDSISARRKLANKPKLIFEVWAL